MISDVLSKDQEIFISQKKCKKGARNNFSWGEDGQCMSHISTENKTKHEDQCSETQRNARFTHEKRETTIFETDAHR